jgi:hypothetical protein
MIVFTDLDLACAWLDVAVADVRPVIIELRARARQRGGAGPQNVR